MADEELKGLIEALHPKLNQIYQLDPQWKQRGEWKQGEKGSILYPPAAARDLQNFAKQLGKDIPPSYVRFLQLHNGWKHFWMDFILIGTSGEHTDAALKDIKQTQNWQKADLEKRFGKLSPSAIKEWESKNPKNLYLENHVVFGTDCAGSVFVFDGRGKPPKAGPVIRHWSIANGASNDEFYEENYLGGPAAPDMEHMLIGVSREVDKYLTRLKRSSARKKK